MKYTISSAVVSSCENYRYSLRRAWECDGDGQVVWIMLNPSTADECIDDPTIRRCVAFTKAWGRTGMFVVNLFARRASKPTVCFDGRIDPVGPVADTAIESACSPDRLVIAAWGAGVPGPDTRPSVSGRPAAVRKMLADRGILLHHLGLTAGGHPKHPLARGAHRIPDDQQPIPWPFGAVTAEAANEIRMATE